MPFCPLRSVLTATCDDDAAADRLGDVLASAGGPVAWCTLYHSRLVEATAWPTISLPFSKLVKGYEPKRQQKKQRTLLRISALGVTELVRVDRLGDAARHLSVKLCQVSWRDCWLPLLVGGAESAGVQR